jgi:photosystem II stability/assembly factor-like uncharacterized protein
VMLRMVELTAFSALSLAPLAGVSRRREARESDLASTEPPPHAVVVRPRTIMPAGVGRR